MYKRIPWKAYCKFVLLFAVILRIVTSPVLMGVAAQAVERLSRDPDFISTMLYFGTGNREEIPDLTPQAGTVTLCAPPESTEPEAVQTLAPIQFAPADADAIDITGSCTYSYDKGALLAKPVAADFSSEGPKILIVHTHGCEAYTPEGDNTYEPCGEFRTLDTTQNVNAVGQAMAEEFAAAGIEAIHVTGCNDAEGFTGAYDRMGQTIEEYLERYPSICMVLDVHRDAYENLDGTPAAPCLDESTARLMLVVGTDEGGLYHPNWQDNLSCALKVQTLLEQDNPGICRSMLLRQSRYNQQMTPCSLLVEVGASGNTLPQAISAGRAFARAVARLINGT